MSHGNDLCVYNSKRWVLMANISAPYRQTSGTGFRIAIPPNTIRRTTVIGKGWAFIGINDNPVISLQVGSIVHKLLLYLATCQFNVTISDPSN